MAHSRGKIVIRSKDVARDHRCEHVSILLVVCLVRDVDKSFGVAVTEIGIVGWSFVNL